jgi:hypothetical protein
LVAGRSQTGWGRLLLCPLQAPVPFSPARCRLTRSLALEYAPKGVRFTSVSPGAVQTPSLGACHPLCRDPRFAAVAALNPIPAAALLLPAEAGVTAMVLGAQGKDPATATPEEVRLPACLPCLPASWLGLASWLEQSGTPHRSLLGVRCQLTPLAPLVLRPTPLSHDTCRLRLRPTANSLRCQCWRCIHACLRPRRPLILFCNPHLCHPSQ